MRSRQCLAQRFPGLVRRTDQAKIAGVCAGLADYFGWKLNGVRFAMIALCVFLPPLGFGIYLLGAIFLPQSGGPGAARFTPATAMAGGAPMAPPPPPMPGRYQAPTVNGGSSSEFDARERLRALEARLREAEAYMTSSRYEFDRELRSNR